MKPYSTNEDLPKETENKDSTPTDDMKEEKHFWEITPNKSNYTPPKPVKSNDNDISSEAREFRQLLDDLFKRRPTTATETTQRERPKKRADSVIEKKLLDLVVNNKTPYKAKSPLPRSMLAPVYGRSSSAYEQDRFYEDENEGSGLFDFLNQSNSNQREVKDVSYSESIQSKQKEMQIIQDIVESQSDIELLDKVKKEIDQEEYPSYYPKVIVKAIEHASQRDPYLALTIFEMVKHKSINSYILGCTAQVYNTLLLLRWTAWGDIYGMLDLMEEMTVNGIEINNDSRRIVREVVYEIDSESGTSTDLFWNSDEKRYCNLMKEMAGKWLMNTK